MPFFPVAGTNVGLPLPHVTSRDGEAFLLTRTDMAGSDASARVQIVKWRTKMHKD
jgi:hypothetical protein